MVAIPRTAQGPTWLVLVGLLAVLLPAGGQAELAHGESNLAPDPGVRYGRLDNGMSYALMANDTPTNQAAIRFRIELGSLMEADDQQGLAHFVEHMAFNGSQNVPEGEMVKILEREGLAFGPDTNASTSFEETIYQLDLPEVDDPTVATALFLLREIAGNLLFEADAVDRERGVVLAELRARNSPSFRAVKQQFEFLAPQARFPSRFPIGEADVIANAPRERMVDLYRAYYRPERAFLAMVGDFDVAATERKLRERFGDWQGLGEPGPDPERGSVEPRELAASVFVDPEIPTQLSAAVVKPFEPAPDHRETRFEDLLRAVGYGVINRRFLTLSRGENAPFTGAVAASSPVYETMEHARWGMIAQPQTWAEALQLGERTLRRALTHGFAGSELREQLANIRASLENAARAAATRSTAGLANGLVAAHAGDKVFTHPALNLELFETSADQVTPQRVLEQLRREWSGSDPLIYLATSEPVDGGAEAVLATWREAAEVAVLPPEDITDEAFAYTDFGEPGKVVERDHVEDLDLTRIRFDNNVMLNLKQTDFRDNQILARVRFGGGLLTLPRELAGLDTLVAVSFSAGGLQAHSADELQRLMAGREVGVRLSMGSSAFAFGGATTPEDFLLQLQLWSAYLVEPGYRPEGYAQYRRLIDSIYDSLDATPAGVVSKDVERLIHDGDPRFGTPPKAQLERLGYEQLKDYMAAPLAAGPIEMSIAGDFDEAAVIDAVARTFGALAVRADQWPGVPDGLGVRFPEPDTVTLPHDGAEDQAMALIYWPTTGGSDDALYQRLNLLHSVMQLRATDRIREQFGGTYSPGASNNRSRNYPNYGYLRIASDVKTGDLEEVMALFDEVADSLGGEAISDDELLRARQPILERLERNLESNGYWLSLISRAQTRPEILDSHRQARELIEAVTVEDLAKLARRYLLHDRRYEVRIVPRERVGD